MLNVLQDIFPLIFVIVAVFFLRKLKVIDKQALVNPITFLAFDIVMPVLLLQTFISTHIKGRDFLLPLLVLAISLIDLGCIYLLHKFTKFENKLLIFTTFTGLNLAPIYPYMQLHYPPELFSKFVLLNLGTLLVIFSISFNIASLNINSQIKFSLKEVFRKTFINPLMLSMLAGIVLSLLGFSLPQTLKDTTTYISSGFGFLVSFLVGLNFELPENIKIFLQIAGLYLLRIVIALLSTLLLAGLILDNSALPEIIFLTLACPFAMFTVVYAQKFNLDTKLAAQYVTMSLFILVVTLPVLILISQALS